MNKWVNFQNVLTTLLITATLSVVGWMSVNVKRVYAEHKEVVACMHAHMAEAQSEKALAQQQNQVLAQIAKDVAIIKLQSMTVVGDAKTTSGDGTFLMVNTSGRASQYANLQHCRVTSVRNENVVSVVVRITGQFRNEDENLIALVSRKAANLLGGVQNGALKIRIEPVEDRD